VTSDLPRPLEPSAHQPPVSSLTWLADLRDRLGPAIELVDPRGAFLLSAPRGEFAGHVRRVLSGAFAVLQTARQRVASGGEFLVIGVENLRVGLTALEEAGGTVLILAEAADVGSEQDRRAELERLAGWLARAIRAQRVAAASDAARDARELSALHRLLNHAVSSGTSREVVRGFIEALAVWNDADVRGYVGDLTGRFALEVSLAGADPGDAPRAIEQDPVPGSGAILRLTAGDVEALRFRAGLEVALAKVQGPRTAPWILAHLGPLDARAEARLAIFVDVLASAVRSATEVEASRLMWALVQRLVGDEGNTARTAEAALEDLADFTTADVGLDVRRASGAVILHVPASAAAAGTVLAVAPGRLAFKLQMPLELEGVLTLSRLPERPFTAREQHLGEIAASILGPWISAQIARGSLSGDRRGASATFEQEIERQAARAGAEGTDLALIIFAGDAIRATPELRNALVGEIRRRLRPLDGAGTLETGEIGVLLPRTSADAASAVIRRLCQSGAPETLLASLGRARVAISSRPEVGGGSLVQAARDRLGSGTGQ
jgi:hypothetical protein